jgi:hypothetical protein
MSTLENSNMASDNQINANRENARSSTGPRTDAGKWASSLNSFRHGLTAKTLLISEDEQDDFKRFRDFHLGELRPEGSLQWNYVDQIVRCAWNLHRIDRMEREYLEKHGIEAIFNNQDKTFDRLNRYKKTLALEHRHAVRELSKLQTDQAIRMLPKNFGMRFLPDAADCNKLLTACAKRSQKNLPNFDPPAPQPIQKPDPEVQTAA